MITVTASAVKHLQSLLAEQDDPAGKGLRIGVETGGCSGMQYTMGFDLPKEGDRVIERDGVSVYVSPDCSQHLDGSTLDYADGLTGAGFRIQNPHARRTCGCGTSFETDAVPAAGSH